MRYWMLIILSLSLFSCASPRLSQEVEQGKVYFQDGDFKKAFHYLLPLAAAGKCEAQYAVGYMYYYGYGVHEDTESGLFWMERAADQHFRPAIKALHMIEFCKNPRARKESVVEQQHYEPPLTLKNSKDEVLQAVPVRTSAPIKAAPVKKQIRADGYSLQLFGAYNVEDAKKMQVKLNVQNSAVIWHAEHNNKDWYVLMYGHYPTVADARSAKEKLPPNLRELGPWVRGLEGLG